MRTLHAFTIALTASFVAVVAPSDAGAHVALFDVDESPSRQPPGCLAQMQQSAERRSTYDAVECAVSWACAQACGEAAGGRYERCMQRQADLWLTVDATRQQFPKYLETLGHGEGPFWRQLGVHPAKLGACAEALLQQLLARGEASLFDESHPVPACASATLAPRFDAWLSAVAQRTSPEKACKVHALTGESE